MRARGASGYKHEQLTGRVVHDAHTMGSHQVPRHCKTSPMWSCCSKHKDALGLRTSCFGDRAKAEQEAGAFGEARRLGCHVQRSQHKEVDQNFEDQLAVDLM